MVRTVVIAVPIACTDALWSVSACPRQHAHLQELHQVSAHAVEQLVVALWVNGRVRGLARSVGYEGHGVSRPCC